MRKNIYRLMKKLFSISFSVLLVLAGLHMTFATHYCKGTLVDTKISLTGEVAGCGMESNDTNSSNPNGQIESACCRDEIYMYSVENTYSPSFTESFEIPVKNIPLSLFTFILPIYTENERNTLISSFIPPGKLPDSSVNRTEICVFRI